MNPIAGSCRTSTGWASWSIRAASCWGSIQPGTRLVGSRGPTPDDIWPIHYLAPLSERLTFVWSGQWALNAWPNVLCTAALLAYGFLRAERAGRSPVGVFSRRAVRGRNADDPAQPR